VLNDGAVLDALDSLESTHMNASRLDTDLPMTNVVPGMDSTMLGVGTPSASPTSRPKQLAPTDKAPLFRSDVTLSRKGKAVVVRDPTNNATSELNELEVSLVRMFDGKRLISEVLANASRLGIPVNLESLHRFIMRLEEQGLLAVPAEDTASGGAWRARSEWETGVRSLFQSGIRLLRMGKTDEAAGYFEALLEQDPDHVEARELLQIAKTGGTGQLRITGPQPAVGAPSPGSDPLPPSKHSTRMTHVPPAQTVWARTQAPTIARPTHHGSRLGLLAPVALVLLGGAAVATFFLLRGNSTSKPAPVTPVAQVKPAPPPPVPAHDAAVPSDAPAPSPVPSPPIGPGSAAQDGSAAAGSGSAATGPDPSEVEIVAPLENILVKAPIAGEVTRTFLDKPRTVKKGERLFEITHVSGNPDRARTLRAKIVDLEKIAAQDNGGSFVPAAVVEATTELARARKELAATSKTQRVIVTAPKAGNAESRIERGTAVKAGTTLGEITAAAPDHKH
jgi:biotin carboxyl carrier protein